MPYRRAYKRPRYGKRDKYSIQQKASVASVAANQTSVVDIVPATTTEGMRKGQAPHMQPDAGDGDGEQRRRRKQPLLGARVCPSRDNCRGTQHRNSRRNSKQHVRTQPVCHELRRHRPYSRSYQDLLSYLSQPQRRRQDLSSSVLLLMGRLQLSLSVCAMQSPSIKSQFRW